MTTATTGKFHPRGLPVLIGSLPLTDHRQALDWILDATPEIPLWPQLPHDPREQMMPQFAPKIPCIVEEEGPGGIRLVYDTARPGFEEEMLSFYEDYLAAFEAPDDPKADSRFALAPERAAGLYLFAQTLTGQEGLQAVKGQVTGPFTMLTGIKDRQGKAGYFDDTIRDMVTKSIAMQAAWQTRFLAAIHEGPVLLFVDEPALAGLGTTAFLGVGAEEITIMINEVAGAIHEAGGLAGIHVCANTDWPVLLESDMDILSFDAHGYFDRIAPLNEEINAFLDRGGLLAWGGVPTAGREAIAQETPASLHQLYLDQMQRLTGSGRDLAALMDSSLITPSCGTGSVEPDLARRVLELTRETARSLRKEFYHF